MLWKKKKKEDRDTLPDLPPLPATPLQNKETQKQNEKQLPSFPDSPAHNNFSQAAIKDAINPESEEKLSEPPESNPDESKKNTIEMEEYTPSKKIIPSEPITKSSTQEMEEPLQKSKLEKMEEQLPKSKLGKNQDIFIRLNKFHSAKKALSETEERLAEINLLLQKIRETKMREDQELSGWEKELENIKARIQEITKNIFEKVD